METTKVSKSHLEENTHDSWFKEFIVTINKQIHQDKKSLESGDASRETREFYSSLIEGDIIGTLSISRSVVSNSIIKHIVIYYLQLLSEKKIRVNKLAMDFSTNKILVWVEIKENDEQAEFALIGIESMVNGKYASDTGIYLDSLIVEESDSLDVPPHYNLIDFEFA
jgi:hypothetical protein